MSRPNETLKKLKPVQWVAVLLLIIGAFLIKSHWFSPYYRSDILFYFGWLLFLVATVLLVVYFVKREKAGIEKAMNEADNQQGSDDANETT